MTLFATASSHSASAVARSSGWTARIQLSSASALALLPVSHAQLGDGWMMAESFAIHTAVDAASMSER